MHQLKCESGASFTLGNMVYIASAPFLAARSKFIQAPRGIVFLAQTFTSIITQGRQERSVKLKCFLGQIRIVKDFPQKQPVAPIRAGPSPAFFPSASSLNTTRQPPKRLTDFGQADSTAIAGYTNYLKSGLQQIAPSPELHLPTATKPTPASSPSYSHPPSRRPDESRAPPPQRPLRFHAAAETSHTPAEH
jgi:hypothetical protein